jgi:hypothetical protein
MKVFRRATSGAGTIAELMEFLWHQRLWWLIPFVAVMLVFGALLLIGEASGIAPFIYTIF